LKNIINDTSDKIKLFEVSQKNNILNQKNLELKDSIIFFVFYIILSTSFYWILLSESNYNIETRYLLTQISSIIVFIIIQKFLDFNFFSDGLNFMEIKNSIMISLKYFLKTYIVAGIIASVIIFLLYRLGYTERTIFEPTPKMLEEGHPLITIIKNKNLVRFLLYSFTTLLLGPVLEEIFYRRLIYCSFREKYSFNISLILSSLIFAVMHPGFFRQVFLHGLLIGNLYEKKCDLVSVVFLHFLINFSTSIIIIYMFKELI